MIAAIAIPLAAALLSTATPAPDLSWMAGDWKLCAGGRVVEEHWLGPAGGLMVGVNLTRTAKGASFEHLRVAATPQGWAYVANPDGRPATAFAVKSAYAGEVVFENLKHDFPKRITYRREGEALVAQIGDETGKGPSWRFLPADKVRCP
jgi:hypothetical protein